MFLVLHVPWLKPGPPAHKVNALPLSPPLWFFNSLLIHYLLELCYNIMNTMPISYLLCLVGQYWHAHGCQCHFWLFLTTPPCRLQNMSPTVKKTINKLVRQVHDLLLPKSLQPCYQRWTTMPLLLGINFMYFMERATLKYRIPTKYLLNVVIPHIMTPVAAPTVWEWVRYWLRCVPGPGPASPGPPHTCPLSAPGWQTSPSPARTTRHRPPSHSTEIFKHIKCHSS